MGAPNFLSAIMVTAKAVVTDVPGADLMENLQSEIDHHKTLLDNNDQDCKGTFVAEVCALLRNFSMPLWTQYRYKVMFLRTFRELGTLESLRICPITTYF